MATTGKSKTTDFWSDTVNMIEMDMSEIINVLPLIPVEIPKMIWGGPGIGKTRIVESYAATINAKCRTIVTSTYEPTDIGGVPIRPSDAENYVEYLVGKWAYEASEESGNTFPMVLLFDDLVTAHEQVQAACYRLFLEREIGNLKLRDNVHLFAAGNRPEDNAATHDMPTPLGNRMIHIYARPSVKAWIDWAISDGEIHPNVVGFIRTHQDKLYTFQSDSVEKAFASPRSLEMLSKTLKNLDKANIKFGSDSNNTALKLAAGLVGIGVANEFSAWSKIVKDAIPPSEIVKNPEGVKIPTKPDILFAMISSCERFIRDDPKFWKEILIFSKRLDGDFAILLIRQVITVVYNLPEKDRVKAFTDPLFQEAYKEKGKYLG